MSAEAGGHDGGGAFPTTLSTGWAAGYYITRALTPAPGLPPPRCVNDDAVWLLSSAKPGNGIPQLLSDNVRAVLVAPRRWAPPPHTHTALPARLAPVAACPLTHLQPPMPQLDEYWQSDGTQPHVISIQFRRRTALSELAFYVDHTADESYTPKTVSLRAGSLHHDLEELRRFELPGAPGPGPVGWVRVPLGDPAGKGVNRFLRTWYLQLIVMGMHANGRDLHIRCVKALGPGGGAPGGGGSGAAAAEDAGGGGLEGFGGGLEALAGLSVR